MKLRYQFRFYPTPEQAQVLAKTFGACRYVYNWGLRRRSDAYQAQEKIGYNKLSSEFTKLRHAEETKWLKETAHVPVQQALRKLDQAFVNFFKKRAKYPHYKSKRGDQSVEYTLNGFKWDAPNKALKVTRLGRLNIVFSRPFKSRPSTVTITKRCDGRYFVTLVLDETKQPLPKTGKEVGIDLGLEHLMILSSGEKIANPRYAYKMHKRLQREQRKFARKPTFKKAGFRSKRRERQRIKVARVLSRIADMKRDTLNKVTTDLVRRFDVICIEDLNVRGMVKNHKLARSLSSASFGMLRQMLTYKCDWYGKELKVVGRFFPSSKLCHRCGFKVASMPLDVREWTCPSCNAVLDRDINAAKNILAEGHSVTARGGDVSRGLVSTKQRRLRRNVNLLRMSKTNFASP